MAAHPPDGADLVTAAQLFAEALATLWAIRDALLLWIVAGAGVVAVCGLGVVAGGVWMWQALTRAAAAVRSALQASEVPASLPESPGPAETLSEPRAPSWAHTDTDNQPDIEEAA